MIKYWEPFTNNAWIMVTAVVWMVSEQWLECYHEQWFEWSLSSGLNGIWAVVWMVTGQWFEQYLSSVLHVLLSSGLNGIWAVVWILFEKWFEWSLSSGLNGHWAVVCRYQCSCFKIVLCLIKVTQQLMEASNFWNLVYLEN
jgi:hypothetical protein